MWSTSVHRHRRHRLTDVDDVGFEAKLDPTRKLPRKTIIESPEPQLHRIEKAPSEEEASLFHTTLFS